MNKKLALVLVAACSMLAGTNDLYSQKKKSKKEKEETKKTDAASKENKTITEATKKCKKTEGLFTIFQDSTNGAGYLLIKKEQVDKEFIYFSHITDGVLASGSIRGAYMGSEIFTIKKYFNKIEFITENTSFYFDESSPLRKAAGANISDAIMSSQTIIAEDKEKGDFLVKADDLFLSEILQQIKPSSVPGTSPSFNLGTLSKEKSKYVNIKSYPMNTDVIVEYVYDNNSPIVGGGSEIADNRYTSIKVQHSLMGVPRNNFKPRYDDPRVGYFTKQLTDMTTTAPVPYKDMIMRWNLEKKDKNASLSEPIEPIVWWIENTTPLEYRETIKNAALTWNTAFEAAGFKNAVQVNIQPDTATWDAGDIRYNVLRWVSSPSPAYGGYGPSFANPRTGQILGADIMLEFVFITNRTRFEKIFEAKSSVEYEIPYSPDKFCSLSDNLHNSTLFGMQQLKAGGASANELSELMQSSLYYLVLHEMGHTMGLNHNMKASQLYSPEEINNKELTSKTGLMGSVMDYPAINVAGEKNKQGQYITTVPGPYDKWAIEYGYSEALSNAVDEEKRLQKILSRSTEPALTFGNDADDMRSPGRGIDPRVNVDDMSNDAIAYATGRIKIAESLLGKLKQKYTTPDQSYQELKMFYNVIMGQYASSSSVISRYVGGIYVDRAFTGQQGATKPYTPVPYKDQKRAIDALAKYIFGKDAFTQNTDLYNFLQSQRRGFSFFGSNEDPKIHDVVLSIQRNALNHLLNPVVMKRITDSQLYGNQYKLPELLNDLTNSVFKDDIATNVNTFRQNLQAEYVGRILEIFKSTKYDYISQANAYTQIKNIEKLLQTPTTDQGTKNHRQYLVYKIEDALKGE